jgi:hypothetical protein
MDEKQVIELAFQVTPCRQHQVSHRSGIIEEILKSITWRKTGQKCLSYWFSPWNIPIEDQPISNPFHYRRF